MSAPKRVLVLGGTGHVGQVVCRDLAAAGARVAFTYHLNEQAAHALAAELGDAMAHPCDLSLVPDIEATVARMAGQLQGLDALVQCAGVGVTVPTPVPEDRPHSIGEVDEAAWDAMMNVNAKGTFFAIRRAIPILRESGGGNIVIIGSVDGQKPVPTPVHYATSKGAQSTMTRAMAKELGPVGIRVNLVAPGALEGGMSRSLPPKLIEEYEKHCGFKRRGRPEEIAGLVSFLALENTYVTGQSIIVDGAL